MPADKPIKPSTVILSRAIRAGKSVDELKAIADREADHYRDAPRRNHHA